MSPLTNPAHVALRDLRNIPDEVLLPIVATSSGSSAVLASTATLSLHVFRQLWDQLFDKADEEDLRLLLKRHLTAEQRGVVLSHSLDRYTIRVMLDHNVLSPTEIRRVPTTALALAVDYRAIDYYENDATTLAYLTPHLRPDVTACYVLRSSPKLFSDDEVLRHVRATFANQEENGSLVLSSRYLRALENLLYHRPHLAPRLAQIPNAHVATALASSRHARYGDVVGALRGSDDVEFEIASDTARTAMLHNPVMPLKTRRLIRRPGEVVIEAEVPADYTQIKDPAQVKMLVNRALAYGADFNSLVPVDLDIPDLAIHPLLARTDAIRLLTRWTEDDDNSVPVWRRVSYATAVATHRALCKKGELLSAGRFEPINPDPVPRVLFAAEAAKKLRQITLDDSIEYLIANSAAPKDAACLTEALGISPHSWQRFFAALDYAPVTTKLRDVISTTSRAAVSA